MRFLFVLMMIGLTAFALGCGGGDQAADTAQTEETMTDAADDHAGHDHADEMEPEEDIDPVVARSMKEDPGPANEYAVMETNHGTLVLRFYPEQAPKTVANFKGLAQKGFYDGIVFHRVIDGFMIQGGDPTGTGRGGASLWGGKFEDEFDSSLTFSRPGVLAMANAGPNTNGSQFFITQVPTPHLNNKHTIFGEVVEGMDVINKIATVEKGPGDKPVEPVVIENIKLETRDS